MQKFFTRNNNMYSKKNVTAEELVEEWIPVEGSKCDFQSTSRNLKFYIENTILIKKGKYTGNIMEYRPFFHVYMFTVDNSKFSVFIPVDHAASFASMLKSVISSNSISHYFEKSVTHGWIVKSEFKNKAVVRKSFGKKVALDIVPFIDITRKLPAFKFLWTKAQNNFDLVVTLSEIDILIERLNGFVNNAPIYNSLIHREMENDYMTSKLEKLESIYNIVIENAKKIEDTHKTFETFESNIRNEISTAFSSAIGTMMSYINTNNNSFYASSDNYENMNNNINKDSNNKRITESSEDENKENDEENVDVVAGDDEDDVPPDSDEIKEIFESPSDDALEITGEISLEDEIKERTEQMNGEESIADILKNEFSIDTEWDIDAGVNDEFDNIESMSKIEEKTREETDKGLRDELAKEISGRKNLTYVENVKDSLKEKSITEIYPEQLIPLLSPDLTSAETNYSVMPKEVEEYYETIDIKRIINTIKKVNPSAVEDSLIVNMMGDSFTRRNLSAMMINRGRVGIPATSVLHAVSIFAAGYETIREDADKNEKKRIADRFGKYVMKCFIDNDFKTTDDGQTAAKYHRALCENIFKEKDEKYVWRLFALDRMLIKDKYDYSYFDMKLETLNEKEKENIVRALIDVYLLLWYTELKHISVGSNTPGVHMVDMFALVNKPMYRFVRTLIVNIMLCSDNAKNMKMFICENITAFIYVVEKMKWDTDIFKDAVISLLSYIAYAQKNNFQEYETDENNYLKNTEIYNGLPFEQPYEILENMINNIKKGQNKQ
jgi:hypothetical protein